MTRLEQAGMIAIGVLLVLLEVAIPHKSLSCGPERALLIDLKEWIEISTDNTEYPRRIDETLK